MNKEQITVIFCIPGNSFSGNFLKAWTNLFVWCINNNVNPILSNHYDSNVYYARQKCLTPDVSKGIYQKPFGGTVDYDYIMWIDSDMFFSPKQFEELMDMDKDIASGIYKMQDQVGYATVEKYNNQEFIENSKFTFLNDEILSEKPDIFPVEYTGFGWMLIKKGVIESMEYPWFRPEWMNFGSDIKDFTSEDVGFCINAIKKGYKIYVNQKIRVGHEKSLII
jgi:hypothetical protein|tara:strand:- start:187 stop:852 length:666 start_codon:yes stop_codon:yes gene_type:complete